MWNYDFTIEAGQTRTIWLINGTYAAPLTSALSVSDDGVFPPANSPTPSVTSSITPTPTPTSSITPTPSVTPTITPTTTITSSVTPTQTPTQTSSITPTPTNIIRTRLSSVCHDEMDPAAVCDCLGTATLFVNGSDLSNSTLAWADEFGVNTGDPVGYYTQNNIIYQVAAGCGIGCITGSAISVYGNCPTITPTPTTTPTPTPTSVTPTPTPTQTITPSSTPSFNFKLGNINTGGVYVSGITVTTGTIVTKSGYSYPVNENELLFADYTQSVTDLDFDIDIKDPLASDYRVVITINGSVSQDLTPGPGDVNLPLNISGLSLGSTDVIFVELQDL